MCLTRNALNITLGEYLSPEGLLSTASRELGVSLLESTSAPSLLSSSFTSTGGPLSPSFTPSFSFGMRLAFPLSFVFSRVHDCFAQTAVSSTEQKM